jgi:uncharacterized membrane protein YfcA
VDGPHLAVVGVAAVGAGFVNAIGGGGSLITFPALVACGVPALAANVTNSVALFPGYLGATFAQRADLSGQRARAIRVLPAAAIGGLCGAVALLATGQAAFQRLVPFLILFAAGLLLAQDRLRARIVAGSHRERRNLVMVLIAAVSVYGGYFGAGMSVIVLAALAIVLDDSLTRLNALKQAVALVTSIAAATTFAIAGDVDWVAAGIMGACALGGGALGGALASHISPVLLRWLIVIGAIAIAALYLTRL